MAEEAETFGRWARGSDDQLTYVPASDQTVSIRSALHVSVVGLAVASLAALVPWFAEFGLILGWAALGVSVSRQHRRWRWALTALVVAGLAAAVTTRLVVRHLPLPWSELLPSGLGMLVAASPTRR
ncbi:hypothetical protein ACN26Y_09970 [Micromonospora sp. WMMD558]|uniref:hypothetical protein n=1 Tax=Micromonospora sp. WMMD558 TaxID=3403462 RepID=UPI003BF4F04A